MALPEISQDATKSLLDQLTTARQIAETLQMRVSTVEAYARRGLLPSVKLGRHRRFIRSEVEQSIARLGSGTTEEGAVQTLLPPSLGKAG